MAGILLIYFVIFPLSVLFPCNKEKNKEVLLDKQDSNVIRGIAASFVILAHMEIMLAQEKFETLFERLGVALIKPFSVLGGMGVLLFFFLSGYGIWKAYGERKAGVVFLKKRFEDIIVPYILMETFFLLICIFILKINYTFYGVISFYTSIWFVIVIALQYFIFYISSFWGKGKQQILLTIVFSVIAAIIFWASGLPARWYNGLLLFPIGMIAAKYEKNILGKIEERFWKYLISFFLLFLISGGIFALAKGALWADVLKTVSGIFLCFLFCIVFRRIKFTSAIMGYIGIRSLYFYVVHVNIWTILSKFEWNNVIGKFYLILGITFVLSELFFQSTKRIKRWVNLKLS